MFKTLLILLLLATTSASAARLTLKKVGKEISALKKVPTPQFRPEEASDEDAANNGPAGSEEEPVSEPDFGPPKVPDRILATRLSPCHIALGTIAEFEPAKQPSAEDKACLVDDPIILMATKEPFPVQFQKGLLLNCRFALRTARFMRDTVQPLANHHIGSPIKTLKSGQGFVCRRRNKEATGKLSEHAFGKAMDWTGFEFQVGDPINVQKGDLASNERAFLKAVRTAACGTFTTVLGPGSDAAHENHFHFDRARDDKKNPYRICD